MNQNKSGTRENPKYLGVLPRRLEGFEVGPEGTVKVLNVVATECGFSLEAGGTTPSAGSACKVTVTKQHCQFIDDGHGGHWVCYDVPTELTGTYDANRGCCAVTDPDDGAKYCVKPEGDKADTQ